MIRESLAEKHRIPRRKGWLEGALMLWFFLGFGAVYMACMDLWDRNARFTPIFLGVTMFAGAVLMWFKSAEAEHLRDSAERLALKLGDEE